MATFGDLKTRIASDMVRDDLAIGGEDEAKTKEAIQSAIRQYQARPFWFLTTTVTVPTVAAQNYITRPATIQSIRRVSIPALRLDLPRVDLTEIEADDEPVPVLGQPTVYAEGEAGAQLRLWPVPNAVFTVKITGSKLLAALTVDADQSVWTNEAYDLICAAAKKRLYRRANDDANEARAAREEAEALSALVETQIDRTDAPVKAGW